MGTIIVPIIVFIIILWLFIIKSSGQREDDFRDLIEPHLNKNKLQFVSSIYPGLWATGPFRKFTFKPQILLINDGAISTGKVHYRKVIATNKKGKSIELWVMIDKDLIRGINITFDPPLDEID